MVMLKEGGALPDSGSRCIRSNALGDGDNPNRVVRIRKLRWTNRRGAFRSSRGAVRLVRHDDPWVPSAPVLEVGGMQLIEDGVVRSH